ncbi:MFS transporter [Pseudorhodoferax sp.]|uniref:MFS transporter n=1 Tax=Pseudorhodoferax sp. TaxID=1993553 RepID=UPI002DD69187|nr:MFS transporter [Pseudorhodoferax sp.]
MMALAVFALQAVPVLGPAIAQAAGLPPAFVGAWSAAVWSAALVGTLAAPPLLARHDAWWLARACLLLCAAGVACVASGHLAGLVIGALLIGLGHGIEGPMASHLLASHVPPLRRALWFSVKQTGVQVGAVAASLVLPLLAVALGWQAAALAVVVLTLAFAAALQVPAAGLAVARAAPAAGGAFSALVALRRTPVLRALAVAAAAFGAVQVTLNGFLVTWAVTERGVSLVQAGAWLGAAQAGGLVGRPLWGWLAGRLGSIQPLLLVLGLVMAGCAAAVGAGISAWPLLVLYGLSASGWNGIFLAEVARQVPPAEAGTATAAVMVVMVLGLVAGPLVFAALASVSSFGTAFTVWSGVALAGCAALWRVRVQRLGR